MYLPNDYLLDPTHRLKVAVVGCGGTGSFVAVELAGISDMLKMLDRKPLNIHLFDNDIVQSHNCNKQKFFMSDVGLYKTEVLAQRINRAYQTDVSAHNRVFTAVDVKDGDYNIIISCVDNVPTRHQINDALLAKEYRMGVQASGNFRSSHLWIDTGNSRDYGQVIMATYYGSHKLPSIIELNPELKDDHNEPSCSVRASLHQQSYNVNKVTGILAIEMLTQILFDFQIGYSQAYFNMNPLTVKTNSV